MVLFIGPYQPTGSRMNYSRVWSKTIRPGPADYSLRGSMGGQVDSTKISHHASPFAKDERGNVTMNVTYSRGPAQSNGGPSVGQRQLVSAHKNAPRSHFGTSTREHSNIMYSAFTYKPQ